MKDMNEGNPFEPPETPGERSRRVGRMIRDNVDKEIITHVRRNREIATRIYQAFLGEVAALPEDEWRTVNVACINRMLEGLSHSLGTDVNKRELFGAPGAADSRECKIAQGVFGRWIIVNAKDETLAWSGRQWVRHMYGAPAGGIEVSSLPTREEAREYAEVSGLIVVGE